MGGEWGENENEDEMEGKIPCRVVTVANQLELDHMIHITQNRDEVILKLRDQLEGGKVGGFELKDGLVFRRDKMNRLQLYVPAEMEQNVIRLIHEKI